MAGPAESRPRNPPHPHTPTNGRSTDARMRSQNPNSVPPPQHPHNEDPRAGKTAIVPLVSYPQPAQPAPRTGTQTNQPEPPHPPPGKPPRAGPAPPQNRAGPHDGSVCAP